MKVVWLSALVLLTPSFSPAQDFIRYHPSPGVTFVTGGSIAIGNGAMPGPVGGGTYSGDGYNIAIGTRACAANTTGQCTAVGFEAGMTNGAGNNGVITAFGWQALRLNTDGHATAFGQAALRKNTTSESAAFGDESGGSNTTGTVACFGYYACWGNVDGEVTAIGYEAGRLSGPTTTMTLVGNKAGRNNTAATLTAIGHRASEANTSGASNTSVGHYGLLENQTGSWNAAFGFQSGQKVTGTGMTLLGYAAGYGATPTNAPVTDNYGTLIGTQANRSVESATQLTNYVGIGYGTLIDKSNQVKIGNASTVETVLYGNLILTDTGARPTCDSSTRGSFWYEAGAAGVADTYEVCRKDAANAYAWVTIF